MRDIMITGIQIRAGMAVCNWSVARLSDESGVGTTTIAKMKKIDEARGVSGLDTLNKVKDALTRGLAEKRMKLVEGGLMPINERLNDE